MATGLVGNALNPKIAVFCSGRLPTLAPPQLPAAWAMRIRVLLHATPTLTRPGGYALLLSRAGRVLDKPGTRRMLGRTTGVVLIGLGLVAATAAGRPADPARHPAPGDIES
ncbi:LysE family translocator [Streptomyces sp. NPDC001292]|uniref:LysE family translocator n=1 Tax=Streptomyces sp. NPDC001292 TaxID=3364558 RepID=UPI003698D52D